MTACTTRIQALLYKNEASFGETATEMGSATRLKTASLIDMSSFQQPMLEPSKVNQYQNEISKGMPGPMGGSFTFSMYLCGHGSSTSGATAITALGELLSWVLGGGNVTASSGHTVGNGSSASSIVTAATPPTFDVGGLFRIGAKNDGRADGQWNVVDTFSGTTLLGEVAFAAAPTLGDVIYSAETIYTAETSCDTTAKRFLIKTADLQLVVHGCFPTAIRISGLRAGEIPMAEITVGYSWFEPVSTTFPDTTSADDFVAAPSGAGSANIQVYGTVTRATYQLRDLQIDFTLGVQPVMSNDGPSGYGPVTGAKRVPSTCTVTCVVDAAGASATPAWWTAWATNAAHHALFSISTAAGSAMAFYFPYLVFAGPRPTQTDVDGLNRVRFQFRAGTDTTESTDDLSLSMMRVGLA